MESEKSCYQLRRDNEEFLQETSQICYKTNFPAYLERGSTIRVLYSNSEPSCVSKVFVINRNHFNAFKINQKSKKVEFLFCGVFKFLSGFDEKIKDYEIFFNHEVHGLIQGAIRFKHQAILNKNLVEYKTFSFCLDSALKLKSTTIEVVLNPLGPQKRLKIINSISSQFQEISMKRGDYGSGEPKTLKTQLFSIEKNKTFYLCPSRDQGSERNNFQSRSRDFISIHKVLPHRDSLGRSHKDTKFRVFTKRIKDNPKLIKKLIDERDRAKAVIGDYEFENDFTSTFERGKGFGFNHLGLSNKKRFLGVFSIEIQVIQIRVVDLSTQKTLKRAMITSYEICRRLRIATKFTEVKAYFNLEANQFVLDLVIKKKRQRYNYRLPPQFAEIDDLGEVGEQGEGPLVKDQERVLITFHNVFDKKARRMTFEKISRTAQQLTTNLDNHTTISVREGEEKGFLWLKFVNHKNGSILTQKIKKVWPEKNEAIIGVKGSSYELDYLLDIKRVDPSTLLLITESKFYLIDLGNSLMEITGSRYCHRFSPEYINIKSHGKFFLTYNIKTINFELFTIDIDKEVSFVAEIPMKSHLASLKNFQLHEIALFRALDQNRLLLLFTSKNPRAVMLEVSQCVVACVVNLTNRRVENMKQYGVNELGYFYLNCLQRLKICKGKKGYTSVSSKGQYVMINRLDLSFERGLDKEQIRYRHHSPIKECSHYHKNGIVVVSRTTVVDYQTVFQLDLLQFDQSDLNQAPLIQKTVYLKEIILTGKVASEEKIEAQPLIWGFLGDKNSKRDKSEPFIDHLIGFDHQLVPVISVETDLRSQFVGSSAARYMELLNGPVYSEREVGLVIFNNLRREGFVSKVRSQWMVANHVISVIRKGSLGGANILFVFRPRGKNYAGLWEPFQFIILK